jgi:hypothetical protein
MRFVVPMIALAGLALSAATRPAPPVAEEVVSNDGTYVVEWCAEPEELPLNEPFTVELSVRAAEDKAIDLDALELSFDARMPAHRHGMRRKPTVTALGEGRFRVEGALLHMPGTWELHYDVTRGAITERAQVRVELE